MADGRERTVLTGPGIPPVLGPYSPGIRAAGFVFVSGQAGIDPDTGKTAGDGFADQVRQALRNVRAVLEAGGSSLAQVVQVTVLLTDFSSFAELNEAFAESFPTDPPARMTIQTTLPGGLLISIGCTALVP